MDSSQLILKATKMEVAVAHLNQKQLAARWSISEATLERRRSEGMGPSLEHVALVNVLDRLGNDGRGNTRDGKVP